MRFRIEVLIEGNAEPHWEEYEEKIDDARLWAEAQVKSFNESLRPWEKPRSILSIEILEDDNAAYHDWRKDITRMSISDHLGHYDGMICNKCGITGKRFGMGERGVKRDSKYRAKKYARCDTAQEARSHD